MFTEKEIKYIWELQNFHQASSEEMIENHKSGKYVLEHDDEADQREAIKLNNEIRKKCEMLVDSIPTKPDYLEI